MIKANIFQHLIVLLTCSLQLQAKTLKNDFNAPVSDILVTKNSAVNSFTTLPHDTCLDKKFSIAFYIIQDSLYTLPNNPLGDPANILSTYSLNLVINKLNETFAKICVSFENCKTVIIPNYSYNKWTSGVIDTVVTSNWYTDKTINVYIPTELNSSFPTDVYSYSSPFPTSANVGKNFIVIQKNVMLASNSAGFRGDLLLHAFGHFFGLPHTFAEVSASLPEGPSTELVNGTNNATAGDKFSDTEADCYPQQFSVSTPTSPICGYKYETGAVDALSNFYTPPIDNIMSAYVCRCRFTQQQYNYMAYMILTRRLYLH